MGYQPTGYLKDMLDSRGLMSSPQFYLKGFIASSPFHMDDLEFDDDFSRAEMLSHCHSRNPMTLFQIDLDKYDYVPLVARNAQEFVDIVTNSQKWFNGKKNIRAGNLERIFETIIADVDLSVPIIRALLGQGNQQVSDEIRAAIRKKGTTVTRSNLMELTLTK